jgi:hypothetical protein
MQTYTNAAAAVARSISHDETARLQTDETESGLTSRMQTALDSLRAYGMEDYSDESMRLWDVWGTHEGKEWRVKIVDLLEA